MTAEVFWALVVMCTLLGGGAIAGGILSFLDWKQQQPAKLFCHKCKAHISEPTVTVPHIYRKWTRYGWRPRDGYFGTEDWHYCGNCKPEAEAHMEVAHWNQSEWMTRVEEKEDDVG